MADVAKFHHDPRALKQLTPPPVFVQLHQIEPVDEGSLADFTMWLGPIPIRWLAVHSNVEYLRGFTDAQAKGPFERWVHIHSFRSIEDNITEVVDDIQVEFGKGLWKGMISRLMWINLPVLFAYRGWKTRQILESNSR